MADFVAGNTQILVSTTVIEVGVDVPNATIMLIEQAERFGLSQLHQLRGRVGRGQKESFCFLFGEPKTAESKERLKAMIDSNDGFYLAEVDLKLRGPGDYVGTRQAGLPDFRIADIIKHEKVLEAARAAAEAFLKRDPAIKEPDHQELKQEVLDRFGKFLKVERLN
jgi:ATP-dependent DNA helicase RecG